MKSDLKIQFEKNGKKLERKLNPDRSFISKDGHGLKLHGRSLLLIRNVGHLMTNSSIILKDGSEVPEGILDALITTTAALHDLKKKRNSRKYLSQVDGAHFCLHSAWRIIFVGDCRADQADSG